MVHVLVICTANVCRSPVGEAVLRDRLSRKGFDDWVVGSAGTWALDESRAAPYSVELMAEQGIDISIHRARLVSEALLADADLVLCMESGHAEAISAEFPAHASRVYLLSEMVGQRHDVSDPYGGPLPRYRRMVAEVTELVEKGLDRIVELAQMHAGSRKDHLEEGHHATNLR